MDCFDGRIEGARGHSEAAMSEYDEHWGSIKRALNEYETVWRPSRSESEADFLYLRLTYLTMLPCCMDSAIL